MFFSYRKSPLGTAVKEYMSSILGVYSRLDEAEKDLEILKDKVSAELKIFEIERVEGWEKMSKLDADLADVVKECSGRYVLIASWGSAEP